MTALSGPRGVARRRQRRAAPRRRSPSKTAPAEACAAAPPQRRPHAGCPHTAARGGRARGLPQLGTRALPATREADVAIFRRQRAAPSSVFDAGPIAKMIRRKSVATLLALCATAAGQVTNPAPSYKPTTPPIPSPSVKPSALPSYKPTTPPIPSPTVKPSAEPSYRPTPSPTPRPSQKPTAEPSYRPTPAPSLRPTISSLPTYVRTCADLKSSTDLQRDKRRSTSQQGSPKYVRDRRNGHSIYCIAI